MKKTFSLFVILIVGLTTFSQVGVGPNEYFFKDKVDDFSEESLKKLKASKTVFLYGEKDSVKVLEKAIKSVWTLTEISLISYEEFDSIDFENTSIFSVEEVLDNDNSISLQLWMQNTSKRGKKTKELYCQIRLHVNHLIEISEDLHAIRNDLKSKKAPSFYGYYYGTERFENLTPGFLKNYLKNVNDNLSDVITISPFKKIKNNPEISKLKTKTIYIPEYAVVNFSPATSVYKNNTEEDINKLFSNYSYQYKIVSNDTLSQMILESSEPLYYMVYVRTLATNQVTIYNSTTGEMIYNIYDISSFNLTGSDLKTLNKVVNSFDK